MKNVSIQRWPEGQKPDKRTILNLYDQEGLRPYSWSNGPGDVYAPHQHSYHKVIYVVQGSITFGLPERGEEVTLYPGDRLDLPAQVVHDAVVGSQGVTCLEAHRGA